MLLNHLKANHSEKWSALGEMTLFLNNSPIKSIRLLKFILSDEHKELDDSVLSKLTSTSKILLIVSLLGFLCLIVMLPKLIS
jgi:hypothetical protein